MSYRKVHHSFREMTNSKLRYSIVKYVQTDMDSRKTYIRTAELMTQKELSVNSCMHMAKHWLQASFERYTKIMLNVEDNTVRSTVETLFVVRQLYELGQERKINPLAHVLHRSAENIRLCRPRASVGGVHTLRCTSEDAHKILASSTKPCGLARVRITVSTQNGLMSRRGCDKAACCRLYCSTCFSLPRYPSSYYVSARTKTSYGIRDLVQLQENVVVGKEVPLASACVAGPCGATCTPTTQELSRSRRRE